MSFSWALFEILLNAFDAFYLMIFPTVKCGFKDWGVKRDFFYNWLFIVIVFSVINFSTDFSFISIYLFPAVIAGYLLIFLKGKITYRIIWLIIPMLIILTIEMSLTFVFANIVGISYDETFGQTIYSFATAILCKLIEFAIGLFILRSKYFKQIGNIKKNLPFVVMYIVCMIAMGLSYLTKALDDFYLITFAFCAPTVLLLINFFNYVCQLKIEKKKQAELELHKKEMETEFELAKKELQTVNELNHMKQLAEVQRKAEQEYYRELLAVYATYDEFRGSLIESLQEVWAKRAKNNELEPFVQINRQLALIHPTGINLIDLALNVIKYRAANHSIALNVQADVVPGAIVDADDICVILDSLLTKAIRMLRQINDMDDDMLKTIEINLFTANEYLHTQIEYPTDGETDYSLIHSVKPNINSAKRDLAVEITNRRQGSVIVEDHDYYLSISIQLPLPICGKVYAEI